MNHLTSKQPISCCAPVVKPGPPCQFGCTSVRSVLSAANLFHFPSWIHPMVGADHGPIRPARRGGGGSAWVNGHVGRDGPARPPTTLCRPMPRYGERSSARPLAAPATRNTGGEIQGGALLPSAGDHARPWMVCVASLADTVISPALPTRLSSMRKPARPVCSMHTQRSLPLRRVSARGHD